MSQRASPPPPALGNQQVLTLHTVRDSDLDAWERSPGRHPRTGNRLSPHDNDYETLRIASALRARRGQEATPPPPDMNIDDDGEDAHTPVGAHIPVRNSPPPVARPRRRSEEHEGADRGVSREMDRQVRYMISKGSRALSRSRSKYSSRSITPEENVAVVCTTRFGNIRHEKFKRFANKMQRMCTKLTKSCDDVEDVLKKMHQKATELRYESIRSPSPSKAWQALVLDWIRGKVNHLFFLCGAIEHVEVSYDGDRAEGEGVVRDYISNLLLGIRESGMFVSLGEESNRYVINPDFRADTCIDGYWTKIGASPNDPDANSLVRVDTQMMYVLAGRIMSFAMTSRIPLGFKLSHSVLGSILFGRHVKDEDLIMYMMLDLPVQGNSMINLMATPSDIAGLGTFEDYDLVAPKNNWAFMRGKRKRSAEGSEETEETEINIDNFLKFLAALARHKLRLPPEMGDHLLHPEHQLHERYKSLLGGFSNANKAVLAAEKVTVPMLDRMLHGSEAQEVSMKNFRAIIEAGNLAFGTWVGDPPIQNMQVLKEWFCEILLDGGRTLPAEVYGRNSKEMTSAEKKELFQRFLNNLVYFWTSLRNLAPDQKYQVVFHLREPSRLPTSATCFYQLKIPVKHVREKSDLYKMLIEAASGANDGFGLLGGSKRKRI